MRARYAHLAVIGVLFLNSRVLCAFPSTAGKALWIEIREKGDRVTTIAMTEAIARQLLVSNQKKVSFSDEGKKDLITKDMLRAVLDGREESVEARDENGSDARLYMKELSLPGNGSGKEKVVLEIRGVTLGGMTVHPIQLTLIPYNPKIAS